MRPKIKDFYSSIWTFSLILFTVSTRSNQWENCRTWFSHWEKNQPKSLPQSQHWDTESFYQKDWIILGISFL